jgi:lysylphosphatidylglycerol synthetase-like protein (DUF2156 family)
MKRFFFFFTMLFPFMFVNAQTLREQFLAIPGATTPLGGEILVILDLIGLASFIVGALALIWFFWGIIQYVLRADNEDKQTQARSYMIYAVIGMFVMFSIWGLVNLVRNTFFRPGDPGIHLLPTDIPTVPKINPPASATGG